jgi:hypothetical protein
MAGGEEMIKLFRRGKTKMYNHQELAKEIHKLSMAHEHELGQASKIPVGTYDDTFDLEELERIAKEESGLESMLKDILRIKADIVYRKGAIWDMIMTKLDVDKTAQYTIDTKTGNVYRVRQGYEAILNKLKLTEEARKNGIEIDPE